MAHMKPALVIWGAAAIGIAVYYLVLRQHVLRIQDTRAEVYVAVALTAVVLGGPVVALGIRVVTALARRSAAAAVTSLKVSLLTGALLALMVALSQSTAFTPTIDGPDPIAELRPITVNGRAEWLSLRGQDRSKPVLLFLSGGPGGSQLVTARHCFADLERDYVVVTWEQPGAAKANGAISPDDITLDTYLSDGAAVTEVLREEFGQDRIYLMGESWGSALGLMLARDHPEHYRAFIGTGQMIDFLETDRIDYQTALDDARARGNQKLVSQLEEQGPPPYESGTALKTAAFLSPLNGLSARSGQLHSAVFSTMDGVYGVEYGLLDKVRFFWGLLRVLDAFYPDLYPIDLRQSAAEQQIPIHIFHGRYDYNAPASLAEDYYARLSAPRKSLVYFEHSAHNPWQTENGLFNDEVRRVFAEAD
ncbi:alpha/beta hydrolase [Schaalia georgiae]|nr:alpha/beta hydrolase [Schaalia georgiae]